MKKDVLARPDNTLDAARWDDAVSSIWFYLLGPGYISKNNDSLEGIHPAHVSSETIMDKPYTPIRESLKGKSRNRLYRETI